MHAWVKGSAFLSVFIIFPCRWFSCSWCTERGPRAIARRARAWGGKGKRSRVGTCWPTWDGELGALARSRRPEYTT
eukprot:4964070-Prymnesium_polylepis.1